MRYLLTSLLCVFTLSLTAQTSCANVFDYDNDGNIAINDFIAMLSYFGDTDSDSDGVFDSEDECIDQTACNYQANPTEACIFYLDAIGVCGGVCIDDADADGICDWECGDEIEHEGYDYSTVLIGEQCWFSENCRYLPEISLENDTSFTDPYYYVYGYEGTDVASAQATSNYETYGVLYNWPAVMTDGICPSGWHIPSDEEFTELTDILGGEDVAGDAMKSTSGWNDNFINESSGNGSNSSGFMGLPSGYLYSIFSNIGYYGFWWSSSSKYVPAGIDPVSSWYRSLSCFQITVEHGHHNLYWGMSARCVRD